MIELRVTHGQTKFREILFKQLFRRYLLLPKPQLTNGMPQPTPTKSTKEMLIPHDKHGNDSTSICFDGLHVHHNACMYQCVGIIYYM